MTDLEENMVFYPKYNYAVLFIKLVELGQQGDLEALHALGIHCKTKDIINMAYQWFYIAASKGHKDSKIEMDELSKKLTEAEKQSAHIFAQHF